MGVPTLSALGIALACNRSGKQPQAGLGRGPKEEKEKESCSRPDKRQKPAQEQTAWQWGGCPGWRGQSRLACPGRSQVGACFPRVLVLLMAGHLLELCMRPRTQGLDVLTVMVWKEEKR